MIKYFCDKCGKELNIPERTQEELQKVLED